MVSDLFKVVLMYAGGWTQLTDYYKNQADHILCWVMHLLTYQYSNFPLISQFLHAILHMEFTL